MNRLMLRTAAMVALGVCGSQAEAHNTFNPIYAPAGYMQDLEMRVTHGCQGSPVKEVRMKMPEGLIRVSAAYTRDWTVDIKMRKLDKPVPGDGGNMVTETVDEIIWKNPRSMLPGMGFYEGFKFRAMLPNKPGAILYFRTVNVCEKGDERYVDLPTETLTATTPNLSAKLFKFMTATPTPSPFIVLEKPARPQYPFAPPPGYKPPPRPAPALQ